MEQITAYFLCALEIMEKELALCRLNVAKTWKGLVWFLAGVCLLGAGILFLARVLYAEISLLIGPLVAGLITAVLILTGGGIFLWLGKKNLK